MSEKIFKADKVHSGQYRRYSDSYYIWNVTTNASKEETLEWCFQNLHKRVPDYEEWHKNTMYGGERWNDLGYYFAGYYKMHFIPEGFQFRVCEPYCD